EKLKQQALAMVQAREREKEKAKARTIAASSVSRSAAKLQPSDDGVASPVPAAEIRPYQLPPVTLLAELPPAAERVIKGDSATTGHVIKETLAEFDIQTEVTNVEQGPVVTRYELLPAAGVRVERIAALSNNIALALKATSVIIQAPVPGKGVVGVEVPNAIASKVFLRDILEGPTWQMSTAALPLALGKDVSGADVVADLAAMPHLLIAGATGSGKTVCMHSCLLGLLMRLTPDQLRLMLVDPKIVEFSAYNRLPHLVSPVITDPRKVAIGLRWAINEMEKRYKLFARVGVRNIEGYNGRPDAASGAPTMTAIEAEPINAVPCRLAYIVIVVDELADLMLVAQADIENCIARLAQLSRAVGIHMILATQRPSVNVITGTIKANFPARIAFQVAQRVDSRTILDCNGADNLLGRGDMLFLPPGSNKTTRAQGCFVTDDESNRVLRSIQAQGEPRYQLAIQDKVSGGGGGGSSDEGGGGEEGVDDELLEQSIQIIRETKRASTSSLQRRLRIGYTRAARIMDIMEERGIVGPPRGSDPREILIDLDVEMGETASPVPASTGDTGNNA
ncbi:MAG: DNA translocase FtsK, partial [Kiritimatiellia bacterium]